MSNKHILHNAIRTFGEDSQINMCIEEMSELTKALCKERRGLGTTDQIAEEIADTVIMLEQMIILFDCYDEVIDWKNIKIKRLAERLREDD